MEYIYDTIKTSPLGVCHLVPIDWNFFDHMSMTHADQIRIVWIVMSTRSIKQSIKRSTAGITSMPLSSHWPPLLMSTVVGSMWCHDRVRYLGWAVTYNQAGNEASCEYELVGLRKSSRGESETRGIILKSVFALRASPPLPAVCLPYWLHHHYQQCVCPTGFTTTTSSVVATLNSYHCYREHQFASAIRLLSSPSTSNFRLIIYQSYGI